MPCLPKRCRNFSFYVAYSRKPKSFINLRSRKAKTWKQYFPLMLTRTSRHARYYGLYARNGGTCKGADSVCMSTWQQQDVSDETGVDITPLDAKAVRFNFLRFIINNITDAQFCDVEATHTHTLSLRLYSPLDLGSFFSFLILYTLDGTPLMGDQPGARTLPIYRTT
jgi:hypothetical protein